MSPFFDIAHAVLTWLHKIFLSCLPRLCCLSRLGRRSASRRARSGRGRGGRGGSGCQCRSVGAAGATGKCRGRSVSREARGGRGDDGRRRGWGETPGGIPVALPDWRYSGVRRVHLEAACKECRWPGGGARHVAMRCVAGEWRHGLHKANRDLQRSGRRSIGGARCVRRVSRETQGRLRMRLGPGWQRASSSRRHHQAPPNWDTPQRGWLVRSRVRFPGAASGRLSGLETGEASSSAAGRRAKRFPGEPPLWQMRRSRESCIVI